MVNGAASVIGGAVVRRFQAEGATAVVVDKAESGTGDIALSADLRARALQE